MNSTVERVGWVAEPTGRGTLGLLVSCATTIFLCTYSAVHPNVPGPEETGWVLLRKRITRVLGCITAPEYFVYGAIENYAYAQCLRKDNPVSIPNSETKWSRKHYIFTVMGGYVVQISPMDRRIFQPADLLQLILENHVEMPILEEKDIEDRSKANWITKSIALIQVSWFLLQLLGRVVQKLAVTTLELYTLGIVICGVVIYAYNWHKPFDVQCPVTLRAKSIEFSWPQEMQERRMTSAPDGVLYISIFHRIIFIATFFAFFACHIVGWNLVFPTAKEQWLWRIGSILCLLLPFSTISGKRLRSPPWKWIPFVGMYLYILIRIALFVEMFTGLRSVPASVYQTPRWSDYLPSFGA